MKYQKWENWVIPSNESIGIWLCNFIWDKAAGEHPKFLGVPLRWSKHDFKTPIELQRSLYVTIESSFVKFSGCLEALFALRVEISWERARIVCSALVRPVLSSFLSFVIFSYSDFNLKIWYKSGGITIGIEYKTHCHWILFISFCELSTCTKVWKHVWNFCQTSQHHHGR